MNASEGLKRIALAVRWLGVCLAVLIGALGWWGAGDGASAIVFLAIAAGLAGAGWTLAWIIEGFAASRDGGDRGGA